VPCSSRAAASGVAAGVDGAVASGATADASTGVVVGAAGPASIVPMRIPVKTERNTLHPNTGPRCQNPRG